MVTVGKKSLQACFPPSPCSNTTNSENQHVDHKRSAPAAGAFILWHAQSRRRKRSDRSRCRGAGGNVHSLQTHGLLPSTRQRAANRWASSCTRPVRSKPDGYEGADPPAPFRGLAALRSSALSALSFWSCGFSVTKRVDVSSPAFFQNRNQAGLANFPLWPEAPTIVNFHHPPPAPAAGMRRHSWACRCATGRKKGRTRPTREHRQHFNRLGSRGAI